MQRNRGDAEVPRNRPNRFVWQFTHRLAKCIPQVVKDTAYIRTECRPKVVKETREAWQELESRFSILACSGETFHGAGGSLASGGDEESGALLYVHLSEDSACHALHHRWEMEGHLTRRET